MKGSTKLPAIAMIILIGFVLLSVWMIKLYIDEERDRDLQRWQDRLSVIAESKRRSIENWLTIQTGHLQELANNPLLQIYLSLPADGEAGSNEVLQGQLSHLRNLVMATARRAGVYTPARAVSASVDVGNADGLAIVGPDAVLRMSTRGFPGVTAEIRTALETAFNSGKVTVHDIYPDPAGAARLLIVVPVKPVQSASGNNYKGAVVGLIDPAGNLYDVVAEQWLTTSSDESVLVTGDEFSTTYITPLRDGFPMFHQVPASNTGNAANFAVTKPADFGVKTAYHGAQVLVTSRSISRTNWLLVQTINADEALRESSSHREFIFTVFLLVVFLLAITFIAVWRHASSVQLRKMTERLTARTDLLNAVTDNINDKLFMLDDADNLVFINKALAEETSSDTSDIRGKALKHVFSNETSARLLELAQTEDGVQVCELEVAGSVHLYHVAVATLNSGQYSTSRLFVLHDITHLHEAQQKHHRLLEGIISTLVQVTDMHDPHCAHHSERTRDVALSIARAMEIDSEQQQTLAMASLLANIGKLKLPRELLVKMEPLTSEEETQMHGAINHTVQMLEALEFDGPVVEVIRQKNEYLDGSGYPMQLSGDQIRMESRVLAVANAFVAMCSARAYRQGMPVHEVLDLLYAEAGGRYDRAVVAALMHVSEQHQEWASWRSVKEE